MDWVLREHLEGLGGQGARRSAATCGWVLSVTALALAQMSRLWALSTHCVPRSLSIRTLPEQQSADA